MGRNTGTQVQDRAGIEERRNEIPTMQEPQKLQKPIPPVPESVRGRLWPVESKQEDIESPDEKGCRKHRPRLTKDRVIVLSEGPRLCR